MGASNKIIEGKDRAEAIEADLSRRLSQLDVKPQLTVISVGNDPASQAYIGAKRKACDRVGIDFSLGKFEVEVNQAKLLQRIQELNDRDEVTGIIVQLPLPSRLDRQKIIETIDPAKDADGLHPANLGRLLHDRPGIVPATPRAIVELIKEPGRIAGKDCTVINDSLLVGKPLALMLLTRGATVNVCHERTKDVSQHTKQADIVVVGVGQPDFLGPEMIKQGATVIDVGINRTEEGLTGDVNFGQVKTKAGHITPVPGGVGPVTVAMLLDNVVRLQEKTSSS